VQQPLQIDADPFHEVPYHGSPHIDSVLVRWSALLHVGGFDRAAGAGGLGFLPAPQKFPTTLSSSSEVNS